MSAPLLSSTYRTVREIELGAAARRLLLKHIQNQSPHVAHLLDAKNTSLPVEAAISALAPIRITHIAPVEDQAVLDDGIPVLITPYFGHASGLVNLESLVTARGGRLSPEEIESAADHILHALDDAHGQRLYNGPIDPRQILIDRQGRVQIEQFGLARLLSRGLPDARTAREEEIRAEVRSVVELLFRCLTGLDSRTIGVSPAQVVSSLDPLLDEWIATGLKEGAGFESAAAARAALPENHRTGNPPPGALAKALEALRVLVKG